MDYSVTFARHFSRLVWLLVNEPTEINEQKAALRALVTISREGPVTLATRDWRLVVNENVLPEALTGVADLAAQLTGHAVQELVIDQGAAPADMLGAARILAAEAVPGDGGRNVEEKLRALDARTVRVNTAGILGVNLGEVEDSLIVADDASDVAAPVVTPEAPAAPAAPATAATGAAEPAAAAEAPRKSGERRLSGAVEAAFDGGNYLTFAAVPTPKGSPADFLGQLDATRSVNQTTRLLDELVTLAENSQREGRFEAVADVFHGVVKRESDTADAELKRAYVMAVRRMAKPTLLRAVAQMLPRRRDRIEDYMAILTRTGEDGADALIEQLTNAASLSDRRVYFDALVQLNAGVSALVHMLGDARWYVARNAADLLGEMNAVEAEGPLSELLKHDDDRVRRAAATSLAKLGTPRAVQALHVALRDTSPEVRKQAAAGLSARKGQKSAVTLAKALDEEQDTEVQLELLKALGRLATPDAVQKLIKAAEAEGRLFKKKSTTYRVAAVRALADARTPAALAMLQTLAKDKDREVCDAAIQVMVNQMSNQG